MNAYYWHPVWSWRWLCRLERRLVGEVAPNGDLTRGRWEYRMPDRRA